SDLGELDRAFFGRTPARPRREAPERTGIIVAMERVLKAFGRSIASQLHPKMLGLLVLPFVVSILFWIVAAWLVWTPLTDWLAAALFEGGWLGSVYGWAQGIGLGGIRDWI